MPAIHLKSILPLVATTAVLGAIIVFGRGVRNLADANEYHGRIKKMVEAIPMKIDDWKGETVELPLSALALLKPNAICSRRYTHQKTGEIVDFLLVQCRTARDMLGHYPPVCYKSTGWQMQSSTEQLWQTAGLEVAAMEYEFRQAFGPTRVTRRVVIGNVLILPDGRYVRDMDLVKSMAGDHTKQAFGAAQVQVRIGSSMSPEHRMVIYTNFLDVIQETIREIAAGVQS